MYANRYLLQLTPAQLSGSDRHAWLADARTAACLANGVSLDDVHPTTGHNVSRQAYETVARRWRAEVTERSGDARAVAGARETANLWAGLRPDLFDPADWPS